MPHKDPEVAKQYFAAYHKKHADKRCGQARDYYHQHKEHSKEAAAKWNKAHPERRKATCRAWRERLLADPIRLAAYNAKRRLHRTGITAEMYKAMVKLQDGKCAICKQKSTKPLRGDHCHKTGKVRGLLCFTCNYGLGMFKDDPTFLQGAIDYLRESI